MARRKQTPAQNWREAVNDGRVVRYFDTDTGETLSLVSYPTHEMLRAHVAARPHGTGATIVPHGTDRASYGAGEVPCPECASA